LSGAGSHIVGVLKSGDSFHRFYVDADASGINFGSGAAATDCQVYRSTSNILNAVFNSGGTFGYLTSGDTQQRVAIGCADSSINFGSGAATTDCKLYRISANRVGVITGADGTQAFQVIKQSSGSPVFGVDTTNSRSGFGTSAGSPSYTVDIGGTFFCDGTGEFDGNFQVGTGAHFTVDATNGNTIIDGSFTGNSTGYFDSLTLNTDLAVADGGTGASVAGTARTNLGAAAASGIGAGFVNLAKLTPGGTNGSINFNADGCITAVVAPT